MNERKKETLKTDPAKSLSTSSRVNSFREKLASDEIKRFELYVSDAMRERIKDIAKIEGISTGVTAQALLKLGIESYSLGSKLANKNDTTNNSINASLQAMSSSVLLSASFAEETAALYSKRLAHYSERFGNDRATTKHANVTSNLIQAALKRKPST